MRLSGFRLNMSNLYLNLRCVLRDVCLNIRNSLLLGQEICKRMKKLIFSLAIVMLSGFNLKAQDFVPQPVSVEWGEGRLFIPKVLKLYYSPDVIALADYLDRELKCSIKTLLFIDSLNEAKGAALNEDGLLQLIVNPLMELPAEGYKLEISDTGILIEGKDYGGVFNGIQTLLQMVLDNDILSEATYIPCVSITDYPRFGYRGVMLDVARTFVNKEMLKYYINDLSHHKINKFHFHISDDEGWRVEIKSHPELTTIGGFRGVDSPIPPAYGRWDSNYGGYYTQDDIREIVEYAAVRNVEIIPEIDLPGHSRAAAMVYPEILCGGGGEHVSTNGIDMRNVFCAARPENYVLLKDIMGELAGLFPSQYIHIGGDEVEYSQWMSCPDCKLLMAQNGFGDKKQLHHYFIMRLEEILARHGKSAAVWNEAMDGGQLAGDTRISGWKNVAVCREAATKGYSTVVMPASHFYFDMKYTPSEPGASWSSTVPTEKVYSFDFEKEGFDVAAMGNVIGVEGALWHELGLANGSKYVEYQLYPRVCALAELAWTPQAQRNWSDFNNRMEGRHYARMKKMGIIYRAESDAKPKSETKYITPQVSVESSLKARKNNPYSTLTGYRFGSIAKTTRGSRAGDYFMFRFSTPLDCASIEFVTGYADLPRGVFPAGYAEVQYDGSSGFVRYGDLVNGRITIKPNQSLVAVRVVCTAKPIGDSYVVVLPLKITGR